MKLERNILAEFGQTEPEKMRQQNIKDIKAFRERENEQEEILKKSKSMNNLTDAIRARKARAELTS